MSFVNVLPRDVLGYLLSYLTTAELSNATCVCKLWMSEFNRLAFSVGCHLHFAAVMWVKVRPFIARVKPISITIDCLLEYEDDEEDEEFDQSGALFGDQQFQSAHALDSIQQLEITTHNDDTQFLKELIECVPNCTRLVFRACPAPMAGTQLAPEFTSRYENDKPTRIMRKLFSESIPDSRRFQLLILSSALQAWPCVYSDHSPESDAAVVEFMDNWMETRVRCSQDIVQGLQLIRAMYAHSPPKENFDMLRFMSDGKGCSNKYESHGLCLLWYLCFDCGFNGVTGCCYFCHRECHRDHRSVLKYVSTGAYCDCKFCK